MIMRITLIRHGKTPGNLEKRYVGRTDEGLSEIGKKELAEKAKSGVYPSVQKLIISPMLRCRQSAEIIFGKEPVRDAIVEQDLREMDFGYFEYKNYKELSGDVRYQEFINSGGFGDFPDGETLQGFEDRCVRGFLSAMGQLTVGRDSSVGVVAHGGTIMAVMNRLCITKKSYYDWMLDNGGFYICDWDGEKLCLKSA